MSKLVISDLHASVNGRMILNGVDLEVRTGELHVLMGPNGSGKSTLSNVIMGNPKFRVESGGILLDDLNVLAMKPDERARAGLFLAFQEPVEISGVNVFNFLRTAASKVSKEPVNFSELKKRTTEYFKEVNLSENFINRYLNEGFSGGEKKRFELLQLMLLKPKIAVLDEIDSGLDMDTLKTVGELVRNSLKATGLLVITHYERIMDYIKPDFIHIISDGKIVKTGGIEILKAVKEKGYEQYRV
jgi:Fe-S cluster assembly ATP-binding protein